MIINLNDYNNNRSFGSKSNSSVTNNNSNKNQKDEIRVETETSMNSIINLPSPSKFSSKLYKSKDLFMFLFYACKI